MNQHIPKGLNSQSGSSTIEFVVVMFAVLATVFFVLEVTLYLFFSASLQKAAQAGARVAVVSTPVASGLPLCDTTNPAKGYCNRKTTNGVFGVSCSDASNPCTGFTTAACTGGSTCVDAEFTRIFNHMQGFSGQLTPENVTVSYSYDGLGYAGGPIIPLVTVTVQNVPFQTGVVGLLLTNAGVLSTLPTHSVSITGEDLNRGGAP